VVREQGAQALENAKLPSQSAPPLGLKVTLGPLALTLTLSPHRQKRQDFSTQPAPAEQAAGETSPEPKEVDELPAVLELVLWHESMVNPLSVQLDDVTLAKQLCVQSDWHSQV